MNAWILQLAAAAVSAALLVFTWQGALALTGSEPVAVVLGALVLIQWICAHKAVVLLRWPEQRSWLPWRMLRATGLSGLWLAAALVTVPLVGAELFGMLAAKRIAADRVVQAKQALATRAGALNSEFNVVGSAIGGVATYAAAAAIRERDEGSTCWRSRPNTTGKVRSFWIGEEQTAKAQAQAAGAAASAAKAVQDALQDLASDQPSEAIRLALDTHAATLEQLRRLPVAQGAHTFVADRRLAGDELVRDEKVKGCADPGRRTLLSQVDATLKALPEHAELKVPALFNPDDHKTIAQGALMRTWAGVLELVPEAWLGGRTPIAPADVQRFGVEDGVLISDATLPLALAWILEAVVLALMFLQTRRNGMMVGPWHGAAQSLAQGLGAWFAGMRGPIGWVARRAAAGMDPAGRWREAPRSGEDFFADATMRRRAEGLVRWRMSYGDHELIVVPLLEQEHLVAARELEQAGLLRRESSAVRTASLLRDARLAPVLQAHNLAESATHWAIFRVGSERFLAWLLAQQPKLAAP